ncbi:MAG TPA: helix-turn-helix domain-containing protein [Rhodocyclaceae bacterium]|jgi:predicted DNA-binding transcriptional regulator AlpA|nr:helix-turn-helix domain-containing protein [Rhodocyclaceae bacterium]
MSVRQVAAHFNVTPNTIWSWVRNKTQGFPAPYKIAGRTYWDQDSVMSWEAEQKEHKNGSSC